MAMSPKVGGIFRPLETIKEANMAVFQFQVTQEFNCTYEVEAISSDEAWDILMAGYGENVDQVPGPITSTMLTSYVEELEI